MSTELDDLIAALPGNVWTTDAAAALVNVDHKLLRFAALASDAPTDHRWLDTIHPDDLIGGALLWQPIAPTSPVSMACFRLKSGRSYDLALRVLVVQAPADAGADRHWIGTFFLDTPHRSAAEHVAIAILERIATLAGSSAPRPATVAPSKLPEAKARTAPPGQPLVAIVGCATEPGEALKLLFEILGWRSIVVERATTELVTATLLTIVDTLSRLPPDIVQPFTNCPSIALLCSEHDLSDRGFAITKGCFILDVPIDLAAVENIVVALT